MAKIDLDRLLGVGSRATSERDLEVERLRRQIHDSRDNMLALSLNVQALLMFLDQADDNPWTDNPEWSELIADLRRSVGQ
jgi:hypothetical protein